MMNYTQKLKHYPDVLSADQAAEILDVSKKTLYKAIKNKELHAAKRQSVLNGRTSTLIMTAFLSVIP